MTTDCDCGGAATFTEQGTGGPCRCPDDDLPGDPFLALRVAFGMLLGEDDFRVLQGNPRGKHMLHQSWLHGAGVVRGYGLTYREDDDQLVVAPGLAVDGRGRELRLDASACVTVADWVQAWAAAEDRGAAEYATGWVVARFHGCLDRPVPAIADPCDVSRRHDDWSRLVESVCIEIVDEPPPGLPAYRRVRALLGLDRPVDDDIRDEVERAQTDVACAAAGRRADVLLGWFRHLAAHDVTERVPESAGGEHGDPMLRTDGRSGVVLGTVSVALAADGCTPAGSPELDPYVRTALLPTATVQELTCGLAPGLIGDAQDDADGPRLLPGSTAWSKNYTRLRFRTTAPVAPGSEEDAVVISSLSDDGHGWSVDGIDRISLEDPTTVVVDLDNEPAYATVRVIIRGTGPTPLFGVDPFVPFAGLVGGPPGSEHDGHDAVINGRLPAGYRRAR